MTDANLAHEKHRSAYRRTRVHLTRLFALLMSCALCLDAQSKPKAMNDPPSLNGTTWVLTGRMSIFSELEVTFAERPSQDLRAEEIAQLFGVPEQQLGGTWKGALFGCATSSCRVQGVVAGIRTGAQVLFGLLEEPLGVVGELVETAILTDSNSMHGIGLKRGTIEGDWSRVRPVSIPRKRAP